MRPLALLLAPSSEGLSWPTYSEILFDQEWVRFRYGQVGLRDLNGQAYLTAHPGGRGPWPR